MSMRLRPWNPTEDIDDMVHRFINWPTPLFESKQRWSPATDIIEKADHYEMKVELPEMQKSDIDLTIDNNYLVLSGERSKETTNEKLQMSERFYGQFQRRYQLPDDVKVNDIAARFDNGMLYLNLPKTSVSESKTQKIDIQ